jgi:hypothetical protein
MTDPSKSEARDAVKAVFSQFGSIKVTKLTHESYKEGIDHKFGYTIEYPNGDFPNDLVGKHYPLDSDIKWIQMTQGINETGHTEAEGFARVYFGE